MHQNLRSCPRPLEPGACSLVSEEEAGGAGGGPSCFIPLPPLEPLHPVPPSLTPTPWPPMPRPPTLEELGLSTRCQGGWGSAQTLGPAGPIRILCSHLLAA